MLVNIHCHLGQRTDLFSIRTFRCAFDILITGRDVISHFLRTAGHADVVRMRDVVAEQMLEPVRIPCLHGADFRFELVQSHVFVHQCFISALVCRAIRRTSEVVSGIDQLFGESDTLLRIHLMIIGIGRTGVQRDITIISNDGTSCFSFLGSYHNHPIGGFHTVNGSCRCIFQYGDTFDILWIYSRDGVTYQIFGIFTIDIRSGERHVLFQNHSVHHPYRRFITIDGGITTDTDFRSGTRLTRSIHYRHARYSALKHLVDGTDSLHHDVRGFYG